MTMGEKYDNEVKLTCGDCKHRWISIFELPMPVGDFVDTTKNLRCPVCGSKKALLGHKEAKK